MQGHVCVDMEDTCVLGHRDVCAGTRVDMGICVCRDTCVVVRDMCARIWGRVCRVMCVVMGDTCTGMCVDMRDVCARAWGHACRDVCVDMVDTCAWM